MASSKTKRAVLSARKRAALAKMGRRETTAAEFLGLTPADVAAVDARVRSTRQGQR